VKGPTVTNANPQYASGGSLLLIQSPGLVISGVTSATNVPGVTGGSSATIATPSGFKAGGLVAVYINTPNTMTAPAGWTLQHHDGQGTVWTQAFPTVPVDLGTWSTSGASGWTYTAIGFAGIAPTIVGAGGGGAQTSSAVFTGTAS